MANPTYQYGQSVMPESDPAAGLVFIEDLASDDEPTAALLPHATLALAHVLAALAPTLTLHQTL